jgi:hypothetical protein
MLAFGQARIDLTIVALFLNAPPGELTSKRMRSIRQAVANSTTMEPELVDRLEAFFVNHGMSP